MFNFQDLKDIHLEITNRCQASCPMCSRNYHGGIENPLIKNQDWTFEEFKIILNKEVLKKISGFYFCGNFGDPIINSDLINMIDYASTVNPDLFIRIHTNGSARSTTWWKNLASALPKNHQVIFAIDGLEDTHSIYRIGTKYETIIENAKAFISAGGVAEWCFIKFKHNEHQADEAKSRAKNLGFQYFTLKNSSRFIGSKVFPVYDKDKNTVYNLEHPSDSKVNYITNDMIKNYKEILKDVEIDCHALHTKEIYIDAYRKVMPCCFLASTPYNYSHNSDNLYEVRKDIYNQYKSLINDLGDTNALIKPIKDIIETDSWQTVWKKYWNLSKLTICSRTCGKIDTISKPKDQFISKEQIQ
jgi:MoaA/NifB/PqqE/SkfB family radical SAM enzyme